jgi:REP element-mobilizing transposase RayT
MPRQRRLHCPRAGIHITARTQDGARHFTPEMRSEIATDIEKATSTYGHTLLAHVVMPNHFHIVIRQGESPLAWVMQRIMQRTVARVRRAHGGEGHVFGRPYWACICNSPAYLRRAIVYTHMNPVKAELCGSPDEYEWSTHRDYCPADSHRNSRISDEGLMLFVDRSLDRHAAAQNYLVFVKFCIAQRANRIPGDWLLPEGPGRHLLPTAAQGDTYWIAHFSSFNEASSFTRANVDVSRAAASLLARINPEIKIDDIRSAGRSRTLWRVRRQIIEGLLIHGCRNKAISRCLGVSPSLVSTVATQMRFGAATAQ